MSHVLKNPDSKNSKKKRDTFDNSSNKKKIRFIINPRSGVDKKKKIEKLIYKYLNKKKYDYELKYTKSSQHATALSKDAVKLKYDIVTAVGGDGTINEVGQGLINTKTALGIIPCGSGNGYARYLKIPINPTKAIKIINECHFNFIDTVHINNNYFLGTAGIGFDAHIAKKFSKSKKRGFLSYLNLIICEYFRYKPKKFELTVDGIKICKKAFLISFAKSSQFGCNITIAPGAKSDDGYFHIITLKRPPLHALLDTVIKLRNGFINKSKYYEDWKCKEVEIKKNNLLAQIDGESYSFKNGLEMKIFPKSLKILTFLK